jgi:hypothetical protein
MEMNDFFAAQENIIERPRPLPKLSWEQKFEIYHSENPHVYDMFIRYGRMALSRGFTRFSAKAIFERLRWYYQFETKDEQDFKLNNSFTAYYARKAIKEFPEFEGFFELREKSTSKGD